MFQFLLDNVVVDDPIGWDKFQETLEFDDELKGVLPKYNSKLTFFGNGYTYLRDKYDQFGYCESATLDIKEDCGNGFKSIFKGQIFISDIKFTIKEKCIADCRVTDASFAAKINNNRSTEAGIDVGRSKNNVAISSAPTITVNFRDPVTLATTRIVSCWDIEDVFRFIIQFMTDGTVGFASNFLTNLPTTERIALTNGVNIRTGGSPAPIIKFKDLFKEFHRKYNTYFTVEEQTTGFVFRLEQRSYFTDAANSVTINNIKELSHLFDNELLYSTVKLGSEDTQEIDAPNTNIPQVRFLTFLDETFNIRGECNIDRELNLISKWQIDSNVIEHTLNNVDDTYDDDFFLIQYEQGSPNQTSNIDYLGLIPAINGFNDQLRNAKVSERFNVQGAIALYLGDGNDEFAAEKVAWQLGTGATPIEPVEFQNQLNDANGNYCVTPEVCLHPNYTYEAPQTGVFGFVARVQVNVGPRPVGYPFRQITISLRKRTSGGALIEDYSTNVAALEGGTYLVQISATIPMNATDYVGVFVGLSFTWGGDLFSVLQPQGRFECVETTTGGGVYQPKSAENYFTSLYDFDQPVSREKWNNIKNNLSQNINFDGRQGWINQVVHTLETKETKFKLLSDG
tara:strand:- start:424 stop:2295 length:1872 start_codon:yes stop_codon:yes gene_type:complete